MQFKMNNIASDWRCVKQFLSNEAQGWSYTVYLAIKRNFSLLECVCSTCLVSIRLYTYRLSLLYMWSTNKIPFLSDTIVVLNFSTNLLNPVNGFLLLKMSKTSAFVTYTKIKRNRLPCGENKFCWQRLFKRLWTEWNFHIHTHSFLN